jgi:hypothetical protein
LAGTVWRVGYHTSPLDFPPREFCSWQNRFDDIEHAYRTVYCAQERLTCLREVLADFRPNAKTLADFQKVVGSVSPYLIAGEIPWAFRRERVLAPAVVELSGPVIDLEDVRIRQDLERDLAALLAQHRMDHLDISEIRSKDRAVTQTISRYIHDAGAAALRFRSKLDNEPCFALFEGRARLISAGVPVPLTDSVPELLQVCGEYSLVLRHAG